ncbi:hypothetical protein BDV26DRAFT_255307 [Aspergillus bertholletiae]|uniref:Uncharacterized protein n=1 Tax=Aspergillus bertholletiae TaxID=1226010 RepID=A0A5N7BI89_9EURO|nr:hypothetical protein BDV26DRAFT_255307 [Aspergillus bertholletiae]
MPFEFINNNDLDNTTRKRIRSRAALGKNKGKKISRPSRKDLLATATNAVLRVPLTIGDISKAKREVERIERPLDDGLLFPGLLPGEPKGLAKNVILFISSMGFSSELDGGLDYAGLGTPTCVQFMFVDEACFHSTMATALLSFDSLVSKPYGKMQALRHASHTFRLVNQKLCSQSAVTDLTIAAVVSMAQYEYHQKRYQQGSAHVQGLWQIAQLRGGVSNLATNPSGLGQKVLRVDLEYALQLGSPTLFRLEEAKMGCKTVTQFPSVCQKSDHLLHHLDLGQWPYTALSANCRDLYFDMLYLASLLNSSISGITPKMNAIELHQDILLLGYRLVDLRPVGSPLGTSSLQNKVYLALTSFLMTLLRGWNGRVVQNDLLSQLLLAEVQQTPSAGQDGHETLLWLLFIGAASSGLWKHPAWVSTTKHVLQGLEDKSWDGVKKILTGFPWVNSIHDIAGQELWCHSQDTHSVVTNTISTSETSTVARIAIA